MDDASAQGKTIEQTTKTRQVLLLFIDVSSYGWQERSSPALTQRLFDIPNLDIATSALRSWQRSEANNHSIRFPIRLNECSISKVITQGFTFIKRPVHTFWRYSISQQARGNIKQFPISRGKLWAIENYVTSVLKAREWSFSIIRLFN